jgi:phage repressor protein C with HTH and peptisase S24 domain
VQANNDANGEFISDGLEWRIKRAVVLAGGPARAAELTSVAMSSIYNYQKLKPSPPLEFLMKLAEVAGVRDEWILLGKLPVAKGDESGDWETHLEKEVGLVRVPVFESANLRQDSAATVAEEPISFVQFPISFLSRLGEPGELQMMIVDGDSMNPELQQGEYVIIDPTQTRLVEGLVLVMLDGQSLMKRLRIVGSGMIELISSNPAYTPVRVELANSRFEIKGRIVWVGRSIR